MHRMTCRPRARKAHVSWADRPTSSLTGCAVSELTMPFCRSISSLSIFCGDRCFPILTPAPLCMGLLDGNLALFFYSSGITSSFWLWNLLIQNFPDKPGEKKYFFHSQTLKFGNGTTHYLLCSSKA